MQFPKFLKQKAIASVKSRCKVKAQKKEKYKNMKTSEIMELVEKQKKEPIPDYEILIGEQLKGDRYMAVFKERIGSLVIMANLIYKKKKKLSVLDIASLVLKIGLPVKTTFEFLQYAEIIPGVTWERLKFSGFTATKIMQELEDCDRSEKEFGCYDVSF